MDADTLKKSLEIEDHHDDNITACDEKTPAALKLDKHGLPLEPQPSDSPLDPLNWHWILKLFITLLVSFLAFTAQFGTALVNPAFVQQGKDLGVTTEQASYCTTVFILLSGVFPIFIIPFANTYGRRICYVIFTLIAAVGAFVSAAAPSYGGVITGRVIGGIGGSIPLGIGAATICDLFTQSERGTYMGIYTLLVTNSPHVAPIAGGYVAERLGWRWCFWIPGIIHSALWILVILTLPETLYAARHDPPNDMCNEKRSYFSTLLPHGKVIDRKIHPRDFLRSLYMVRYAAVLLPAIYFMTNNAYGSSLFAVTGARLATTIYGFNTARIGLFLGVALTAGNILGEACAGWLSDVFVRLDAKRRGSCPRAEARLFLIPGCTFLGIGTAVFGYCVQRKKPWIDSTVCMAVSGYGSQLGTTMVYTYTTDCYKGRSGEIGAILNFAKAVFGFTIGFYALPFGESAGYDVSFPTLGAINLVLLLPLVYLFFRGEQIRKRQGAPSD